MKTHKGLQQPPVEKFLVFTANIKKFDQMEEALRMYSQFLPPALTSVTARDIALREVQSELGPQLTPTTLRKERLIYAVGTIVAKLRRIWTERDPDRREYLIFTVRRFYHTLADPDHPDDMPALTPFQQAMMHLARNADRMGRCINPECPASFFLGKDSHGRTFCSSSCAGPAKRLAKLKWWRKNPQRRRGRRQS